MRTRQYKPMVRKTIKMYIHVWNTQESVFYALYGLIFGNNMGTWCGYHMFATVYKVAKVLRQNVCEDETEMVRMTKRALHKCRSHFETFSRFEVEECGQIERLGANRMHVGRRLR